MRTRVAIRGTGMRVPEGILTNADFERMVDTTDEWITTRTGIRERHICAAGEHGAALGADAVAVACAEAGIDPAELELLVCSTSTPDHLLPSTACEIQARLGLRRAGCFDVQAACSGFIYATAVAQGLLSTGLYRNAVVVAAEKMSAITDYTDRATCVLFGDGAGAAVLVVEDGEGESGILSSILRTDGTQMELLWRPAGGAVQPSTPQTLARRDEMLKQEGRQVYRHAVRSMADSSREAVEQAGLALEDVDWVVPHQANLRIIEGVAGQLGLPMSRMYVNIERFGNTSSASIPIALDEGRKNGRFRPGMVLLLVAFGSGFTWGAQVIRL
ncbi:MAG: ketoacyl-ACP synthase III [Gemmatimonadetes bacterium]|nr:ketoacyl-ACP synthase III [Gemmatimonadota bacterium]